MPFPGCGPALTMTLLGLFWMAGPTPAHAGEAHYLYMFGSQRTPSDPNYSHTWATFVRVTWAGDGPFRPPGHFVAHTISWLPANKIVRLQALLPEPGQNFGLHETIQNARNNNERISLWGPYLIDGDLFLRALARKARLESGEVRYKANDTCRNTDWVTNCIHGVGRVTGGGPVHVASPGWGEVASYAVLLRLRPWILDETPQHWLTPALGLGVYPIIYRGGINPPRSGAILGPWNRLFGGERGLRATYGPPGVGRE